MDHDDDDVNEDTAAADDSATARKRRYARMRSLGQARYAKMRSGVMRSGVMRSGDNDEWYSDNFHDNEEIHSIEWANWFAVSVYLFLYKLTLCHRVINSLYRDRKYGMNNPDMHPN